MDDVEVTAADVWCGLCSVRDSSTSYHGPDALAREGSFRSEPGPGQIWQIHGTSPSKASLQGNLSKNATWLSNLNDLPPTATRDHHDVDGGSGRSSTNAFPGMEMGSKLDTTPVSGVSPMSQQFTGWDGAASSSSSLQCTDHGDGAEDTNRPCLPEYGQEQPENTEGMHSGWCFLQADSTVFYTIISLIMCESITGSVSMQPVLFHL